MSNGRQGKTYALLDSRNAVLTQGRLEKTRRLPTWRCLPDLMFT